MTPAEAAELDGLLAAILDEAREVDAQAARVRGQIRGMREELDGLQLSAESLDRRSIQLRQKVVNCRSAIAKAKCGPVAIAPDAPRDFPQASVTPIKSAG
jgi:hypothetical protein